MTTIVHRYPNSVALFASMFGLGVFLQWLM